MKNIRLKQFIIKAAQFLLFLLIGAAVFYWLYRNQDATQLWEIIKKADFFWIWLSLGLGLISHLIRAIRWQMLIEASDKKPSLINTFMSVMSGYLANLALPRMGEVTRCGILSKYSNLSFVRLAGTVVAERLTDLSFLLLLIATSFILEFHMLRDLIVKHVSFSGFINLLHLWYVWMLILAMIPLIWWIRKKLIKLSLFAKLKTLWAKFTEGFSSLKRVKNKPLYLFYSFAIWVMYFLMQYVCFFAFDVTSHLTVSAGIIILATGSIGMLAPVQGGIGPWHAMVIATLAVYGITNESAYAFALLVHGAQNALVVVVGLLSLIAFPLVNSKIKK